MKPLQISVVIITHNRVEELKACLQNLQQQTMHEYELVVVDNASTDQTPNLLAEHFPKARVITCKENLGIAAGRNKGYEAANGDICVTLDDDAALYPADALERVVRYFSNNPSLCCLSFDVLDMQSRPIKHFIPRRDRKPLTEDRMGAFFVGTGHAMHRKRFLELGGFWEDLGLYFGEEPDLSYRILAAGYDIIHTAHIAVQHVESNTARPKGRRIYYGTRNIPWIALKNLPWYSVCSLTLFSWGYYFFQALLSRNLMSFIHGACDSIAGIAYILPQRGAAFQKRRSNYSENIQGYIGTDLSDGF